MRKFVYVDGRTYEDDLMSDFNMGEFFRKEIITHPEGNPGNHGAHPGDLTFFHCEKGFFVLGADDKSVSYILTERNRAKYVCKEPEDRALVYFFQDSSDWRVIPNASLELACNSFWDKTWVKEVREMLVNAGYTDKETELVFE